MDSLWTAATGMLGQQTAMDVVANNLANVNTNGYKRGRTAFADLLYREIVPEEAAKQGNRMGLGSRVVGVQSQLDQGALQTTGGTFDLAIEGNGYFEVKRADGTSAYTRNGAMGIDANGALATTSGEIVQPPLKVPANATDVTVGGDGTVTASVDGKMQELGKIKLATFPNAYGLSQIGDNLFAANANSGAARAATPGQNGAGLIRQGMLEASNVNAADEMVQMIQTQRAYEASAKIITASDEMLGIANALRRG